MENRKTAMQPVSPLAKSAGEFLIGGDLRVTRLGFGAMRITGDGVWGEPSNRAGCPSSAARCRVRNQFHRHRGFLWSRRE